MLASARASTGGRAGAALAGFGFGEVRLLPDAVAQHRVRVRELAGFVALRHPDGPEAAAVEAEGLSERLDVRLLGERDRTCAQGVRRRHGLLTDSESHPLRNDVARRCFYLQIGHFRAALQEPKRPRLLPQPPALVPLLVLDALEVEAVRRCGRAGLLARRSAEEALQLRRALL